MKRLALVLIAVLLPTAAFAGNGGEIISDILGGILNGGQQQQQPRRHHRRHQYDEQYDQRYDQRYDEREYQQPRQQHQEAYGEWACGAYGDDGISLGRAWSRKYKTDAVNASIKNCESQEDGYNNCEIRSCEYGVTTEDQANSIWRPDRSY